MTRVLVAEDEAAIGLALEDLLVDNGYSVAGPFHRCSIALEWLRDNTPDLALLDLRLGDGPSIEVARLLLRRGVPVLFFSGEISHIGLPSDLRGLPWLEKPVASAALIQALRALPLQAAPPVSVGARVGLPQSLEWPAHSRR